METVLLEVRDGVANLTLNRPEVLNAFSMQMLVELRAAFKQVAGDPGVRVLVVRGAGRAFCTGSDLSAPRPGLNPDDPDEFLRDYYLPAFQLLASLEIATVAAVHGPAAGAGMSLALSCDIVLASEAAYFLQPFVNVGLVPDLGSSWLLPHMVGRARASGLVLLGEKFSAREAAAAGLIWRCTPVEGFEEEVQATAARLGAAPWRAVMHSKRLLRDAFAHSLPVHMQHEIEAQRLCMRSDDAAEARQAFAQKRKPVFSRRKVV